MSRLPWSVTWGIFWHAVLRTGESGAGLGAIFGGLFSLLGLGLPAIIIGIPLGAVLGGVGGLVCGIPTGTAVAVVTAWHSRAQRSPTAYRLIVAVVGAAVCALAFLPCLYWLIPALLPGDFEVKNPLPFLIFAAVGGGWASIRTANWSNAQARQASAA